MERHRRVFDRCVAAVTAAATMSVPEIAIAKIQAAGSRSLRTPLAMSASSAIAPMSPILLWNERLRTVASNVAGRSSARQQRKPAESERRNRPRGRSLRERAAWRLRLYAHVCVDERTGWLPRLDDRGFYRG
jgi:hypothetical protein